MRRIELAAYASMAPDIEIPDDGLSLPSFATAFRVDPRVADVVARYLHRKRLLWLSKQAGHLRIYPASMRPGRGRPRIARPEMIDPRLASFLAALHPVFLTMKLLRRQMPAGTWRDEPELRSQIQHALTVEADKVMAAARKFLGEHRSIPVGTVRDALWLDQPDMMQIVIETQPELDRGDRALSVTPLKQKKLPANLSNDERVLRHIERAGRNGIAAYKIAHRLGVKREDIETIGLMFENMGMVRSEVVRTSSRGRKGLRYFAATFGEPLVTPSGQLIMQ